MADPEFHAAGEERVNAFLIEEAYLFKHYFEEDEVFAELAQYYDDYEYRFEVPAFRLADVRSILGRHGYALVVVDAVEEFAVAKRKYTNHPEILFSNSVYHQGKDKFNCFVMKDREAVTDAVNAGARHLPETSLTLDI